ncbi:hypothetical protein SAMD00019534_119130 [Acytostelium subglobosum LB1]|uniref:hypothetical protein n=1 Tax=Acytostelium subglobosum LB1 TaxID=1410327 RepID=UPI0006451883|nr:hypothetical protein SAMD00019534_119130 [Acytostelium subglobosum LB1]GAM28737.1 hypothetical protein SAMD00019534_119130 [Acytostelium subglobosum LB1]|eukprot:XP_012748292.1 hypothetical protein SAMD00019534_119130 [Acytostelium subglobosum LB1]
MTSLSSVVATCPVNIQQQLHALMKIAKVPFSHSTMAYDPTLAFVTLFFFMYMLKVNNGQLPPVASLCQNFANYYSGFQEYLPRFGIIDIKNRRHVPCVYTIDPLLGLDELLEAMYGDKSNQVDLSMVVDTRNFLVNGLQGGLILFVRYPSLKASGQRHLGVGLP